MQTLNGRLPLKQSSHSHETWPKYGSDDSQHFIFRHRKNFFGEHFGSKNQFFADFVGFRGSCDQTDVNSNLYVKFCFRTTDSEVCTTENHREYVCFTSNLDLDLLPCIFPESDSEGFSLSTFNGRGRVALRAGRRPRLPSFGFTLEPRAMSSLRASLPCVFRFARRPSPRRDAAAP